MIARSRGGKSGIAKLATAISVILALSLLPAQPCFPQEGIAQPNENRSMSLALDALGRPWAVWEVDRGQDTDVYYSRLTGRAWEQARPLSADPEAWEGSPSLTFDADGTAWAAWVQSAEPGQTTILVSHWNGDRWSTPMAVLGTTALTGRQPQLAAAPDGGLWLAWVGYDGIDDEIFVSRCDGGEPEVCMAWSAPYQVGVDDQDRMAYDTHPRLALDKTGQGWLAWASHEGHLNDEIHVSHWDGDLWSAQQQVNSPDDTPDGWPSLALGAEGLPWVAWHGVETEGDNRWRIYFSRWDAARVAWHAEWLVSSPPTLAVDEQQPSLAFDAQGQAHLSWAISGSITGIAHAGWGGVDWESPAWTETAGVVERPAVAADGAVRVHWLASDGAETAPVKQRDVEVFVEPMPRFLPAEPAAPLDPVFVPNRHLAHGDSITRADYEDKDGQPATPYPVFLEQRLDANVGQSEVINSGKNGEKARAARDRLEESLLRYQPQFLEIMEGTNDVKGDYSPAETAFAVRLLVRDARETIPGIRVVVASLTPRLDPAGADIPPTNAEIFEIARRENVPVADQWQAYHNYGPWEEFYLDVVHPGTTGLRIIADTFYETMIAAGMLPDDTTPPTAWIVSLPPQSDCAAVPVTWTGDDGDGSGIASFDVQVQDDGGPWTNWLVQTPTTSASYLGAIYGHTLGFRVRARDQLGNVGDYSPAATTQITDNTPPDTARVAPLPPYQLAPFAVRWWANDLCSQTASYDVEYRIDDGSWVRWLTRTPNTEQDFAADPSECGKAFSFRARAYDAANNRGDWSDGTTSTILACHAISGHIQTVRGTPIRGAQASASPRELGADASDTAGFYTVYFDTPGTYDITAVRDRYGALPARQNVAVAGHVTGVDFYLPPLDDQVDNGGFEGGGWGSWQRAGSQPPTLTATAHTGSGAALLDGDGGDSHLSQSLTLPAGLNKPTLSLMVRLANNAGPASKLTVQLAGVTTTTDELTVPAGDWVHAWVDASPFSGQAVTLRFTVSNNPAVVVDEISMGSAMPGTGSSYLPLVTLNR